MGIFLYQSMQEKLTVVSSLYRHVSGKKLQVVVSIKCHRLQEGKYNKLRKI